MTQILGIVNVTRDSFSDGGRFLRAEDATARARELAAAGADYIDLGAESTHPDSEDVSAEEEIRRLDPVIDALVRDGVAVSVDTSKPAVMRFALERGAAMINDVNGLRDADAIGAVRASEAKLVVMFSRSATARAERAESDPDTIVAEVEAFFEERLATLTASGIARERIILDPGMGFFLGRDPLCSVAVLRAISRLVRFGVPLLISVSRKSFLAALAGDRRPADRGPATLAAELFAVSQGAVYIRTHEVRALRDGLRIWSALNPGQNP